MFAEERKHKILAILQTKPAIRVGELCGVLNTSEASIRRDLRELERSGLLQRTHGGAVSRDLAALDPVIEPKEVPFQAEKTAIAKAAAKLVLDQETILLDAGSTTLEIARQLRGRRGLSVVTNGLEVARELASSQVQVSVTGGSLRRRSRSLVGPLTEASLAGLHADKLFLAANGVNLHKGITTPNLAEAAVKRAMVKSAGQVILVADHSKLGRVTFSRVCPIEALHCLVTDEAAPAEFIRALKRRGLKVVLAAVAELAASGGRNRN